MKRVESHGNSIMDIAERWGTASVPMNGDIVKYEWIVSTIAARRSIEKAELRCQRDVL